MLPEVRAALLRGIALTRLPEALEWLAELVRNGGGDRRAAAEALKCVPIPEEIQTFCHKSNVLQGNVTFSVRGFPLPRF